MKNVICCRTKALSILALFLTFSFLASKAQALTKAERDYLTINKITVQQIPDETPLALSTQIYQNTDTQKQTYQTQKSGGPLVILDMIIGIGQRIWTIAENHKPIVGAENNFVSAVPFGIQDPMQLTGWQGTRSYSYNVTYTNLFGVNIVDFSYRVVFAYGGNYEGRGRYLTGVTIERTFLDVGWSYSFNSHVEVPTITNAGTQEDPVAELRINLVWSVDTILKHNEMRAGYLIDGRGGFRVLE